MPAQYQLSPRGFVMLELAYDINVDQFALFEPHSRRLMRLPTELSAQVHRFIDCGHLSNLERIVD